MSFGGGAPFGASHSGWLFSRSGTTPSSAKARRFLLDSPRYSGSGAVGTASLLLAAAMHPDCDRPDLPRGVDGSGGLGGGRVGRLCVVRES